MSARGTDGIISLNSIGGSNKKSGLNVTNEDKITFGHVKFAQGLGPALRMANELHAVQQTGRLPFLPSSKLHEDVLRGNLGPGTGFKDMFGPEEETMRHFRLG